MTTPENLIVFDIKKYAIHDGPGIRTTVFLKGCPLSCWWCHNPEGLSMTPQLLYIRDRCIGCRECVQACPRNALSFTSQGVVTDRLLCRQCGACAAACPAEALELAGREMSVDHLVERIEKDILFYDESGGGVTVSGGEPLLQADSLVKLLSECGKRGIHRAVDTTGFADQRQLLAVSQETDLFLFDLKLMDPEKHKTHTGVSNEKILANLERLARDGAMLDIRIPLVPGVNDDADNLDRTGAFVAALPGIQKVTVLPYHDFQKSKYRKFGMTYRAKDIKPHEKHEVLACVNRLKKFDLAVTIGG